MFGKKKLYQPSNWLNHKIIFLELGCENWGTCTLCNARLYTVLILDKMMEMCQCYYWYYYYYYYKFLLKKTKNNLYLFTASGTRTVEVDSRTKSEFNEGSTLKMYCIDRSYGFDTINFTKDGKQLLPGDDPRVNITHEQKAEEEDRLVLSVKNLTLNDSGNYECVMELDPSEFGSINITVKSKWSLLSL